MSPLNSAMIALTDQARQTQVAHANARHSGMPPDRDVARGHGVENDTLKKPLAILFIFTLLSLSSYVTGVYALSVIIRHFPALAPFVFVDTHGGSDFTLASAALQPGGFLAVVAVCLTFDALCLGLDRSALKRLLEGN